MFNSDPVYNYQKGICGLRKSPKWVEYSGIVKIHKLVFSLRERLSI